MKYEKYVVVARANAKKISLRLTKTDLIFIHALEHTAQPFVCAHLHFQPKAKCISILFRLSCGVART